MIHEGDCGVIGGANDDCRGNRRTRRKPVQRTANRRRVSMEFKIADQEGTNKLPPQTNRIPALCYKHLPSDLNIVLVLVGRSRVLVPMRWIFFNLPNPSNRTMALASIQLLTELSTRNLPGGKGQPTLKADKFRAICEPIV
jgi:hypothetical protein